MTIVCQMLNRFLTISTGLMLGFVLSLSMAKFGAKWKWWPPRELNQSIESVAEVMRTVNAYYIDENSVEPASLKSSAIQGVLGRLDQYSQYMPPGEYQLLQEEIDGEFGGIGIQVEIQDGHVVIINPIPGTPGDRAGILRGDRIVKIDGQAIEEPLMDQVVRSLRGKVGATVSITLFRPSQESELTLSIKRERIYVDSVRDVRLLDGAPNIGYIQIVQFSDQTGKDFKAALKTLTTQGAQALVIDLRNNPGGLLEAAVSVLEPFFKGGELIVSTKGRSPEDTQELRAPKRRDAPLTLPLAVIINGGSASAAEIVTGALKDTDRAVIVGEKSFGKGSVQTIFNMRGGAGLRLTTARYYTPAGTTIHGVGISPDIEVKMTPEEEKSVRRAQLYPEITDPEEFKKRFGIEWVEDRPLQSAIEALKETLLKEQT